MADNLKGIPFSTEDEGVNYIEYAKRLILHQYNISGIGTPRGEEIDYLRIDEIYVVWFSYTLGNWKALLSTARPDGRYYEVTHKRENDGSDGPAVTFVDTYLKTHNVVVENFGRNN